MDRISRLTPLVAPIYRDERAGLDEPVFTDHPPVVLRLTHDRRLNFSQIVVITEKEGRRWAHIVSDRRQAKKVVTDKNIPLDSVGNYEGNPLLPEESEKSLISLGGDYPGLFLHLLTFQRARMNLEADWDKWTPRIAFGVAPTCEDESHGMIGIFGLDRRPRVYFYPSKEEGLRLLRETGFETSEHEPFVHRSTLPATNLHGVVELAPDLAHWLVFWYPFYQVEMQSIR